MRTGDGTIRSAVSIALMCTTCRRIPAIANTNQGPERGDLIQVLEMRTGDGTTLVAGLMATQVRPTPYTLRPAPYTLHPSPYFLHPTPYTLHPTCCTLYPTPYTLHLTPYTLHPKQVAACAGQHSLVSSFSKVSPLLKF